MYIDPMVTTKDVEHIAMHLTEEAQKQVELYRIDDVFSVIFENVLTSEDFGTFRDEDDNPVALYYAYKRGGKIHLGLHMTPEAIFKNYRKFARCCKSWLESQGCPVICTIPEISHDTLRMVSRWGFRFIRYRNNPDRFTLEYREGITDGQSTSEII